MNILIVEDDPMVGQINQKFASKQSFVKDIVIASSLAEAKDLLSRREFDLLLLDVYFPTGRGPDLLQWIRSRKISLDVIFITADNSPGTVERALHLGALDYLVKPFTLERFTDALEDAHRRIMGIQNVRDFDQDSLDHMFHKTGEKPVHQSHDLDKGMSYKTYKTVHDEVMKTKEPFTAEQMGERLGIARVTIRRYLDFMEKQELLTVELQYGKVGRPQHYYHLKDHL
ncbi:response regulator [Oceanispirochaeta crateris]|uniref:Transcriptional regulatory protein n=1 Tax=Oceanispirochaeta crateris TaxID=2518645 RepID=A0A5C1QQ55_9SPIO|nr:response regulator [Oceanispirochaeta crateris]QEN08744.1 response regulator [Oceanispirochaeta crateris]